MKKETMIENVCKMMQYADEQLKNFVTEGFNMTLEGNAFGCIAFVFDPQKGSCIVHTAPFYGRCYTRLYANHKDIDEGLHGRCDHNASYKEGINAKEERTIRAAMLKWNEIKERIKCAVIEQEQINNFVL